MKERVYGAICLPEKGPGPVTYSLNQYQQEKMNMSVVLQMKVLFYALSLGKKDINYFERNNIGYRKKGGKEGEARAVL